MTHNPNQPDTIIDRTLAALRSATPPEGMEARIAERLASRDASAAASRFAAVLPQSAWLRGALTGAAIASLAFAALLFAAHLAHTRTPQQNANLAPSIQVSGPNSSALKGRGFSRAVSATAADGTLVPESASTCAPSLGPTHGASVILSEARSDMRRAQSKDPDGLAVADAARPFLAHPNSTHLIPASFAPSRPAPPAPLTAQERALVQLVRTASPAQLAALNPAAQAKADADRQAAFQKFFAPSPEIVAAEKAQDEALGITAPTPPPPAEVHN